MLFGAYKAIGKGLRLITAADNDGKSDNQSCAYHTKYYGKYCHFKSDCCFINMLGSIDKLFKYAGEKEFYVFEKAVFLYSFFCINTRRGHSVLHGNGIFCINDRFFFFLLTAYIKQFIHWVFCVFFSLQIAHHLIF